MEVWALLPIRRCFWLRFRLVDHAVDDATARTTRDDEPAPNRQDTLTIEGPVLRYRRCIVVDHHVSLHPFTPLVTTPLQTEPPFPPSFTPAPLRSGRERRTQPFFPPPSVSFPVSPSGLTLHRLLLRLCSGQSAGVPWGPLRFAALPHPLPHSADHPRYARRLAHRSLTLWLSRLYVLV